MGEHDPCNRHRAHRTQCLIGHLNGQTAGEDVVDHDDGLAPQPRTRLKCRGCGRTFARARALVSQALGALVFKKPKALHGQLLMSTQCMGQ